MWKIFKLSVFLIFFPVFLFLFKNDANAIPYCGDLDYSYTVNRYTCQPYFQQNACRKNTSLSDSGSCNWSAYVVGGNAYCGGCRPRSQTCAEYYDEATQQYNCLIQWAGKNSGPSNRCNLNNQTYFSCDGTVPECGDNSDCSNNNTCVNGSCVARYGNCNTSTGDCSKVVGGAYANLTTCNNNCDIACTYPSSSWSNLSCGGGNCTNNQMRQVNTGSPTSCTDTYRCQNDSAGAWVNGACGGGSCSATQRQQTRTVTNGCQYSTTQCVADNSCGNYNISGTVYKENGGNNSYQPSDTALNNVDVYRSDRNSNSVIQDNAHKATTNSNGDYTFSALSAGDYRIRAMPNSCDYSDRTTNPATFTIGPNEGAADFGFDAQYYTISGNVYVDTGNNDWGGSDTGWAGTVRAYNPNGGTAGSDATNASGGYSIPTLSPNTYSEEVLNLGTQYDVLKTRINGTSRNCGSGGLNCSTAIQSAIDANCGNVTVDWLLGAKYNITGTVYVDTNNNHILEASDGKYNGATLSVDGSSPVRSGVSNASGVYSIANNSNGTYNVSISGLTGGYTVDPNYASPRSVTVSGADATLNFLVDLPSYAINGNVFMDDGQGGGTANDGIKNGSEANVPDGISISGTDGNGNAILACPQGPGGEDFCVKTGASAGGSGKFTVDKLRTTENNVSLSYTPSTLYFSVWPTPPNMGPLTIGGANCFPSGVYGAHGATCTAGSIGNLNFAVRLAEPWIQTSGTDTRTNGSYNNPIPPSSASPACPNYASIPITGVADEGNIFMSGNSANPFGLGSASPQGWNVRNQPYPSSRYIRTSYSAYLARAQKNAASITAMTTANFCASGTLTSNCQPKANLPKGVYAYTGNLSLGNGTPYTFGTTCVAGGPSGACNYTILVNGNVTINSELKSPKANRTVLVIAASSDITVSSSLGVSSNTDSTTTNLEGIFSADRNFIIQGTGTPPDKRLNIAGAVVANANPATGGTLSQQRDLLAGNKDCPAFSVIARPDFVVNYPSELKEPSFNWTELAPTSVALPTNPPAPTPTPTPTSTPTPTPTPAPAFRESGGQAVMEAENYQANNPVGTDSWYLVTDANAVGGEYIRVPQDGTGVKYTAPNAPETQYRVYFQTTGTYYVWLRMWSPNGNSNAISVGLNGALANHINSPTYDTWDWENTTSTGTPVTINVSTAGYHTFSVWERKDGARADRIVVKKATGAPTGNGPAESPYN